jgi:hypothetical protein
MKLQYRWQKQIEKVEFYEYKTTSQTKVMRQGIDFETNRSPCFGVRIDSNNPNWCHSQPNTFGYEDGPPQYPHRYDELRL